MTMTCLDQPMVRRDRYRAVFPSVFATLWRGLVTRFRRRGRSLEDFSEHMLRDVGFLDGRVTEAAMRRAAGHQGGLDRF